ncbi:gem-associated protein 8 isoform X2 [Carettochelys insculpta]|uniref:gem-associated protein 8 isoform X2 n=1 Tax=Carettochelys insculpta TaxID=44489 RepID=UPI003EB8D5BA
MEGSLDEGSQPWYYEQVYARYWKHYNQAMHWMYKHKNAYRKAMESFYQLSWYPPKTLPTDRYSDWDGGNPSDADHYSACAPSSSVHYPSWPQQYAGAHCSSRVDKEMVGDSEMEENSESEEEIECDLSNMEITEELRQYFAQTERHRQELREPGRTAAAARQRASEFLMITLSPSLECSSSLKLNTRMCMLKQIMTYT